MVLTKPSLSSLPELTRSEDAVEIRSSCRLVVIDVVADIADSAIFVRFGRGMTRFPDDEAWCWGEVTWRMDFVYFKGRNLESRIIGARVDVFMNFM